MEFDASVQGVFYKTVVAPNTGEALKTVIADIAAGFINVNPLQPHNIIISPPKNLIGFEKWAAMAPPNPVRFDVWIAPDNTEWIYDQPRNASGQYTSDDPNTPNIESALRWLPYGV